MTKKSLVIFSLLTGLVLTACTNDNKATTGSATFKDQAPEIETGGSEHVNDLGEQHWKIDPNKQHKLFRMYVDRNRNKCNTLVFVADQMNLEECENAKARQLDADDIPQDYSKEDMKIVFGVDSEPVKGLKRHVTLTNPQEPDRSVTVVNWVYTCTTKTQAEIENEIGKDKFCDN